MSETSAETKTAETVLPEQASHTLEAKDGTKAELSTSLKEMQGKGVDVMKINRPLPCFWPSHDGRTMHSSIQTINMVSALLQRPLLTITCGGLGQAVAMNGMVRSYEAILKQNPGLSEALISTKPESEGFYCRECNKAFAPAELSGHDAKHTTVGKRFSRVLWIEDDIALNPGQAMELARAIMKADENGWNLVTPYCTGFRDGGEYNWVYFKNPNEATGEIGRPFTEEEIQALMPFEEIHALGGLGFYYGDLFLDYVWYEGTYNGHDRFGLPSYSGIDWNYMLDNRLALRHYPVSIAHEKPVQFGNARVIKHWGDGRTHLETDPNDKLVGVVTDLAAKARAADRTAKYVVS